MLSRRGKSLCENSPLARPGVDPRLRGDDIDGHRAFPRPRRSKHAARVLDPAPGRFRLLCPGYPENPVLARHGRDIHPQCLRPGAALRALRSSMGIVVSSSSPTRVISTATVSRASAPAASPRALFTLSQQSEKCPRSSLFGFLGPKQLVRETNRLGSLAS